MLLSQDHRSYNFSLLLNLFCFVLFIIAIRSSLLLPLSDWSFQFSIAFYTLSIIATSLPRCHLSTALPPWLHYWHVATALPLCLRYCHFAKKFFIFRYFKNHKSIPSRVQTSWPDAIWGCIAWLNVKNTKKIFLNSFGLVVMQQDA